MPSFLNQILVPLTLASFGLLALLTTSLVLERIARNRRERLTWERRSSYELVLAGGEPAEIRTLGESAARTLTGRSSLVDALAQTGWTLGPVFTGHEALRGAAVRDIAARDVAQRAVGVCLLGVIGDTAALTLLVRMMREDPDLELRLVAVRALRIVGDEDAAWSLICGLRDGVLPTARIIEQLGRPFAANALLEAMDMTDFERVRADLAEALGLAGHVPAAYAIARLASTGNERERMKACRALGRLADPVVVPLLIGELADKAWAVRAQAATALGACGHASAIAPLAHALADANWWVRANSATSLRKCGAAGVAALRQVAAESPDRYARDRAEEALALEAALAARPMRPVPMRSAAA